MRVRQKNIVANKKPIRKNDIEKVICEVAEIIHAKQAILFGSMGRGTETKRSDVDVLFVQETKVRFLERPIIALRLLTERIVGRSIDVLIYTPMEVEMMRGSRNRFIQRIYQEGKIVYGR